MTKDEWIARAEPLLHSILFAGYVSTERDPAWLFRAMRNDAERLQKLLDRLWNEAHAKPAEPEKEAQVNNGAAPAQKR